MGGGRSDGECKHAVLKSNHRFKTYKEVPATASDVAEMIAYHKKAFIVHYTPHGWMKYVKYLHQHQSFDVIRDIGTMYREGSNDEWEAFMKQPALYKKTPKKTTTHSFDIYQVDYSPTLVHAMKQFVACLDRFSFHYLRFVVRRPFLKEYYHQHLKKEINELTHCMDAMYTEIMRVRLGITKVFKRSTRSRRSFVGWG